MKKLPFFETENHFFSKSGQPVWAKKFISTLPDETEDPFHLLALNTDITNRKQQAEDLLDSHVLNASILNSLTSHIALLDEQGVIVTVNNAWRQFAEENGLLSSCQGLLGVNYLDACKKAFDQPGGEEANAAYTGIMAVLTGVRKHFDLEYPCHSPDQQRWFHMKVSPLEGSRRWVVVVHENITERKQAKLQLQEKAQMLSESQRLAHIGSWSVDLSTGLLSWSDETYTLFGVTKKTFGHTMEAFYDLVHPDDHDAIKTWVNDCLAGIAVQGLDYRIILPDGSNRIVRASGGLQLDDRNKPLRMAGSIQDITERMHREQQDQVHLEQLAHVTRLGLMSEMAAGITHEINQPLSAISIYSQTSLNLIQMKNPDLVILSEILTKTQQLAIRAGEIIQRMRDFLQPQAKPNTSTNLNELIQNSVNLCSSYLKEHNIELMLELEDSLPPICVDPIQIEQVLINLIRNSIDALQNLPTTLQRHLSIQTQLMINKSIQVRVKDNGPGIAQDLQHKILTPFYTSKSAGMGMGLSISRSLIEAHAGTLKFNSQLSKGTTFYFTLPSQSKPVNSETVDLPVHQYSGKCRSVVIDPLSGQMLDNKSDHKKAIEKEQETQSDQTGSILTSGLIHEIDQIPTISGTCPTLKQLLNELTFLLANGRFISDELLAHIKRLLPHDQQLEFNHLCQFIHNTDYPQAQLLLKTNMGLSDELVEKVNHDQRPVILVVDDMRDHQEAMATLLSLDFQIKVAGNGPRALKICQCSSRPDLVLLDVNLPLMNGYEICRKLQENRLSRDIPVIFVTAATYQESEIQGLQLGAIDYITKPINPTIALLRIRNLMMLKQLEKELKRIAQYDTLTGIPNRALLADRIKQAIAQANRQQKMLCICYLDLDGFKRINDTLGHQAGDQVLVEITQRIGHILREADTVARIGGDEFVVLLPDLNHVEEYRATVKRLLKTIALPVCIQDQSYILTASIGVSIFPDDNSDWDMLLSHADQAMYVAKQSGKNRYHMYDPKHNY